MELKYFKHFDLPLSFEIDLHILKQKFYVLSKKYHPDFYLQASEEVQAQVLENATLTNKAFQTLSNQTLLIEYVLKESGVLTEGEKDSIPTDFLMEMMDFNEEMMELEMDFDEQKFQTLKNKLEVLLEANRTTFIRLVKDFEKMELDAQMEILKKVKENFLKNKYLLRIQKKISIFASH